jgi:hypothetical protein
METKTLIIAAVIIAATASLAIAPSLLTGAYAREHTLTTCVDHPSSDGCPGSSADPGKGHEEKTCKATGSGKCVPGQDTG